MIIFNDLHLEYGAQVIFNGISSFFRPHEKIGLVGRNGAGKSTLIAILAGVIKPDSGTISIDKKYKIAYFPQHLVFTSTKTVFDEVFSVFDAYLDAFQKKQHLEEKLAQGSEDAQELLEHYQKVHDLLLLFDNFTAQKKTNTILEGLGFSPSMIQQPVDALSVGWKMRVLLAKLLLSEADFYLFDEPTNHLDIVAKEWFLQFLQKSSFGYALITHDAYFLQKACSRIIEIENGALYSYTGNFDDYVQQKEQRQEALQKAYNRQQKEIQQKMATIERFRASASKAGMAQSMLKKIEAMPRITLEPVLPKISIAFPPLTQSASRVLTLENISFKYPEKNILLHADAHIERNQKIALIAPNGTGKTTLLKLIAGIEKPQQGTISFGPKVSIAFFKQDQELSLDQDKTILETVSGTSQASLAAIRSLLGSFLFSGEMVDKKIGVLSGGEKQRVAMVQLLLQNANFLILDEPTNHLDIQSKSVLAQALKLYAGTIIFVSHDHFFINEIATDVFYLKDGKICWYPGNYESYTFAQRNQDEASYAKKFCTEKHLESKSEINDFEQRKKMRSLEGKIKRLEEEKIALQNVFVEHPYGSSEFSTAEKKLKDIDKTLQQLTQEWESLYID